jgi:DNA-binding protein YbaB
MPGSYGLDGLGDQLNQAANDLREVADQVRQATEDATAGTYTASSPDEHVEVTVDGRCRVSAIRLHAYLLRESPDNIDRIITATVNDALGQARAGRERALLDGLPPRMRADVEAATAEARRTGGAR